MTDSPHSPIAPCPNPECRGPCDILESLLVTEPFPFFAWCSEKICGYTGPGATTEIEAIRLHNLVCRSSSVLEELGAPVRSELIARIEAFARRQLAETGIHDRDYKDIAPFDAGKRECARALLQHLTDMGYVV